MEKILTIFERGPNFKVIDKPKLDCQWVFDGEGVATEKIDGTNVRLTIRGGQCVRVEKRRNPTKTQKAAGIIDGWYVDASEQDNADKWLFEGAANTDTSQWPDGEHSCEAMGPRVQGNPLDLPQNICVPFNLEIPAYDELPRTYDELKKFLPTLESKFAPPQIAEGIVFHHPDGRRAKIKRKDF